MLTRALGEMGIEVVPSRANFVMIVRKSADDAEQLFQKLLRAGVIVRPLAGFGLPHCVRITVGTEAENNALLDAMRQAA